MVDFNYNEITNLTLGSNALFQAVGDTQQNIKVNVSSNIFMNVYDPLASGLGFYVSDTITFDSNQFYNCTLLSLIKATINYGTMSNNYFNGLLGIGKIFL